MHGASLIPFPSPSSSPIGSVICVNPTWGKLLGDVVGGGGRPLGALDAADVVHYGLGHVEGLLVGTVPQASAAVLQEYGLHALLKQVLDSRHVEFIQAHLGEEGKPSFSLVSWF